MRGVCGQINHGSLAPVRRADIDAMTKSICPRGADGEFDGPLGCGSRRLSIIDLSGGGGGAVAIRDVAAGAVGNPSPRLEGR
jgi:asparagine synthetase B (glutamine-hydrolysing)